MRSRTRDGRNRAGRLRPGTARVAGGLAAAALIALGAAVARGRVGGGNPGTPTGAAGAAGPGRAAVSVPPEPAWLAQVPDSIRVLYRWALANRETLQYIPCYCGCGDRQHGYHKSNADCYGQVRGGRFVHDPHAVGCGVCLNITAQTIRMQAEGRSLAEMRRAIDEQYAGGGVPPTPTPLPPA